MVMVRRSFSSAGLAGGAGPGLLGGQAVLFGQARLQGVEFRGLFRVLDHDQRIAAQLAAQHAPQVVEQEDRGGHGEDHAREVEVPHRPAGGGRGDVHVELGLRPAAREDQPADPKHQHLAGDDAGFLGAVGQPAEQHVHAQVGVVLHGDHRAQEGEPDEEPARHLFRHGDAGVEGVAQHDVAEHHHHHHRQGAGHEEVQHPAVAIHPPLHGLVSFPASADVVSLWFFARASEAAAVQQAARGQVVDEGAQAELPGRRGLAVGDAVAQHAQPGAADGDLVAELVGEAGAGFAPVFDGREERAEEQHETVRVLVGGQGLRDDVGRVTADAGHGVDAAHGEAIGAAHFQMHGFAAHVVHAETGVEQPDEGADGAGGVVVLGLAEQQGAAALDVAQVDVVAQRGAHDVAAAVHGQHHLGLGVVPGRIGADADLLAGADGCQYGRLGEDLGVGADADLQVLGPQALLLQQGFQGHGLGGARADVREVLADQRLHLAAQLLCARCVAARLFLDHALDHAGGEGHAGGLDHLQVAGREQEGQGGIAGAGPAVAQQFVHRAQSLAGGLARGLGGPVGIEQGAHGGEGAADVEHALGAQRHHCGAALRAGRPGPGHQRAGQAVVGQQVVLVVVVHASRPRKGMRGPTERPRRSVVVAGRLLGDAAEFQGEIQRGAVGELARLLAVERFPGRAAGGHGGRGQFAAAAGDLFGWHERVAAALFEVDQDQVAGLQPGEAPACGALGRGVEDRGAVGGAGLPAVAQRGQGPDAALDQRIRRLHVDHLGRAGPAQRAGAAHDQDAVLVDGERGIVDARVVVLGAVEDDGPGREHVFVAGLAEVARAEGLGDHRGFHDAEVEQVAREHQEAGLVHQWFGEGADHLAVRRFAALQVLGDAAAGDAGAVAVQPAGLQQFPHHRGHAAGAEEALAQVLAGGLHVDQERQVVGVVRPVARMQFDAGMARHRLDVHLRVAGAARAADHRQRVEEALAGEHARGAQVFVRHLDDAAAGGIGHLAAFAVGRGDGRAAGQRQAQRLGHRVHGGGRAHGVAVAGRGSAVAGALQELFLVDLAGRQHAAAAPDDGARADQFVVVPAIEHRPAREHDGGDIDGGGRHDAGRRGLVAAGGQHHRVDRVAVEDLDQAQVGEVAVQCGRRPAAVLEDRVDREFDRDAARVADAVAHPARQFEVDAVAGGKIAAGLGDADDRPARAQFLGREPVVHEALEVERGHVGARRIGEPVARAEAAAFAFGWDHVVLGYLRRAFSSSAIISRVVSSPNSLLYLATTGCSLSRNLACSAGGSSVTCMPSFFSSPSALASSARMALRSNAVASFAASCTIFCSSGERVSQVFFDISSTQVL